MRRPISHRFLSFSLGSLFRFLPTPIVAQHEDHRRQLEFTFITALQSLLKSVSLSTGCLSSFPMYRNTDVTMLKHGAAKQLSELRPKLGSRRINISTTERLLTTAKKYVTEQPVQDASMNQRYFIGENSIIASVLKYR